MNRQTGTAIRFIAASTAASVMLACASSGQVRNSHPLQCINGEQIVCTGRSGWRLEQNQDTNCSCQRMEDIDKIH